MARIQNKRGTGAQWGSSTVPLLSGEVGYETDGDKSMKIGDGVTLFNDLPERALPPGGTQGQVPMRGTGTAVVWGDPTGGAIAAVLDYDEGTDQYVLTAGDPDSTTGIRTWRGPTEPVNTTGPYADAWVEGDDFVDTSTT